MLDGSGIDSSSRFNGKGSQRNMILGKMLMISTLMTGPNSYKRETTISILRRTSIADTPMLWSKPTLLLSANNQPKDGGCTISPWGHGLLVGGTAMILHFSLFFILIILIPLHSTPFCSTPNSQFPYFPDHHCASHSLALPCLDRWLHSIHKMLPTYDMSCHCQNTFPPAHIPGYHTACSFRLLVYKSILDEGYVLTWHLDPIDVFHVCPALQLNPIISDIGN